MKLKKICSLLTFFTASFLFAIFLSCRPVNAIYELKENYVESYFVSRDQDKVNLSIRYQYGIKNIVVNICDGTCAGKKPITTYQDAIEAGKEIINNFEGPTTFSNGDQGYSIPTSGIHLNAYTDRLTSDGKVDNTYYIQISATFCKVRSPDYKQCNEWDASTRTLISEEFQMNVGFTSSSEMNKTISQMLNITNNVVIPILWVILGIILIVRGIMLGIDIVKTADEPEVRKKKISGLIWLFVGIFLAFVVTGTASAVMSMFGYGGIFA